MSETKMNGKVLGITFEMTFPFDNAESFDSFMGKSGACYERAVQHFIAHSYYGRVRAEIVKALEKISGIERNKTTDENGKSVKYTETEEQYVRRVMGELGDGWSEVESQLAEVASKIAPKADTVTRSRSNAASRKIAEQLIKAGQAQTFADKRGLDISGLDGDDLVEAIAIEYNKAIKEVEEAQKRALGIA